MIIIDIKNLYLITRNEKNMITDVFLTSLTI